MVDHYTFTSDSYWEDGYIFSSDAEISHMQISLRDENYDLLFL